MRRSPSSPRARRENQIAVVTFQPRPCGSIRPGGKWRAHGKGDRLDAPDRRSGATPVSWSADTCAARPSSIRIGNLAASSANSIGSMVTRAAKCPFAAYASRIAATSGAGSFHAPASSRPDAASSRNVWVASTWLPRNASSREPVREPGSMRTRHDRCRCRVDRSRPILARRNPASMEMLAGRRGQLVVQQVQHDVAGPRLPKAIEEIIAARVARDLEHRPSSTRDAVLEIDGTLLAFARGRRAHRDDARRVAPCPSRTARCDRDPPAMLELKAVALSQLRVRQRLLGAEAGFARECHRADLVMEDSGGAGPSARGDTGAEGNLLAELDCLLRALTRRHADFVAADRPIDDGRGGLVLLEVFRQHELELRPQPL